MQKTVESEKKRLESRKVFNNKHMKKIYRTFYIPYKRATGA